MNVKYIRRLNMRALANSIGGITPMAERINKSQSQISHLIGINPIKNIGDKIAVEVEQAFGKPAGWLDQLHHEVRQEMASYHRQDGAVALRFPIVPVLGWEQVDEWLERPSYPDVIENKFDQAPLLPISFPTNKKTFALRVSGDSMESPSGVSFIEGSTIIVEPEIEPKHGTFVICRTEQGQQLTFKQLILDGDQKYLKPLNPRYPMQKVTGQLKIIGVVRQLLCWLDV